MTLSQVGQEFSEPIHQLLFIRQPVTLDIESGKTRGIRHIAAILQLVELHLTGSMPAPAQLLTDLRALSRLDFPTPEFPVKAEIFPRSNSRT